MSLVEKDKPYHHGDLRAALLKAAEAMVERVGVEGLSLRELTREIGVSSNAPRRHFPNKQVLLDALALQGFERLGMVFRRAASSNEREFSQRIIKVAKANIRFAMKNRSLYRLMFASKQRAGAPVELLDAAKATLTAGGSAVVYGQSVGAVIAGDPDQLGLTLLAAVEGLMSLSVDGKFNGVPIEHLAEQVIENIVLGLKPR